MKRNITAQLSIKVQQVFGKPIMRQSDISILKDEILIETNQSIGFNTLRRFFNFLPKSKPNNKTLNILSQYVGFKNYEHFYKNYLKEENWNNWLVIARIENKDKIEKNDIDYLDSLKNLEDYPVYIGGLIKTMFLLKKYKNLHIIFNADELFNVDFAILIRISVIVSLQLRNIPINEIRNEVLDLTKLYNFRYVILHHFPDYNNFNGYYGVLSKESEKHAKADHDIFFFQLINSYREFLIGEFNKDKFKTPVIKEHFHPILKGRFYGLMILTDDVSKHQLWFDKLIREAKLIRNKIGYFLEIIPKLIIAKKIEYLQKFMIYFTKIYLIKEIGSIIVTRIFT